ncbi:protein FAR1-RELATED SEQUENCE 5-like [Silene latifolia]|uniref:protein FAR1-RELATED SEQUENCE 5-like n=1 Tax=Silene latifolia TaxID=37657 RepID=UPI003D781C58
MAEMEIVPVENGDDLPTAPVTEEELCRQVEDIFTPYVGMQFGDMEEAITFYMVYALGIGFDVRKYTTKKWRDGTIKSKLLVCNREGFTKTNKESMCKEVDGEKQERKAKLKRVGCKARVRLFLKNGLLVVDRFDAEHNHELVSVRDREFQKLSRNISKYHMGLIIANSRLNIGPTRTYRMCKELVKGFENIGASLNDFKNFKRDIKCFIHERDGQLFIDRFKSLAETQPGFYFDYDVDEYGSLRRAIWADGIARRNYAAFGEAVSYDPTYSTNKYSMVFTPFTGVDNHKRFLEEIKIFVIWDEDLEADEFDGKWLEIMAQHDVGDVEWFTECYSKRRQWVMAHCKDLKMGAIMRTTQRSESENRFFKRFEHKSGTLVEFLMRFESAMEQQRHNQKRLDNENRQSNPKLSSKMALESDVARVYTHNMFEEFQQELKYSTNTCSCKGFIVLDNIEVSTVQDSERNRNFEVKFNPGLNVIKFCFVYYNVSYNQVKVARFSNESLRLKSSMMGDLKFKASCSCRLFERKGLLCSHVIWIYYGNGVKKLPECGVARRWTKDAYQGIECSFNGPEFVDVDIIDAKQLEMTKLWSEVHETIGILGGKEKEDIQNLTNLIREFKEKLCPSSEKLSKEEELESYLVVRQVRRSPYCHLKFRKTREVGKGLYLVSRKLLPLQVSRNVCAKIANKWHTTTKGTALTRLQSVHHHW